MKHTHFGNVYDKFLDACSTSEQKCSVQQHIMPESYCIINAEVVMRAVNTTPWCGGACVVFV